jgi:hypothetical protein
VVVPPWGKRRPLRRANTRYPLFTKRRCFRFSSHILCHPALVQLLNVRFVPLSPSHRHHPSGYPSCPLHYVLNLNLITTHSLSFSFTLSFSVHVHWASSVSGTLKFGHVFPPFLCVHSVSPSSPHAVSVDNYVSLLSLITVTPPPQLALFTTMFPLHAYFGPLISPLFPLCQVPVDPKRQGDMLCLLDLILTWTLNLFFHLRRQKRY